jgi:predicted nucleotidyltransferase component of viral defense system
MSGKSMGLKARIRNLAKEKDVTAQVVLQNYMFERFLVRLSKSKYQRKFILKGGVLIAAIVGMDKRSTMDLDATIKGYPLNVESLENAILDILNIYVNDHVTFTYAGIERIREDDEYGGYRIAITADYDSIRTPLRIDITTGDAITPNEVQYLFKMIFDEGDISIWAYNVETVLAEKVETILRRVEGNTRPRDFYDLYILTETQRFEHSVFIQALRSTSEHRNTTYIFLDIENRFNVIRKSDFLKARWLKYMEDYSYAEHITYEDIMNALGSLIFKNPN